MFLVHEILTLHPKSEIIVAHFNHQLRAEESDRDERFVRDFCRENKLMFERGSADIKKLAKSQKLGLEEVARNERYAFLETVREKYTAKYILTAHHLDDSIETFVFNLIRGTKLTGLSGISERNNHILRPLLHIQKETILKHCQERNIHFVTDSTNIEETIQRNFIRHRIIPLFTEINPNHPKAFDGLMRYFTEIQKHLNSEILQIIHENTFSTVKYEILPGFLRKELLRHLFSLTNNGTIGLTESNLDELDRYVREARGGTVKTIKNLTLTKKQGIVTFQKTSL
jgi:tRNA(Ile)-lysidine synthase